MKAQTIMLVILANAPEMLSNVKHAHACSVINAKQRSATDVKLKNYLGS